MPDDLFDGTAVPISEIGWPALIFYLVLGVVVTAIAVHLTFRDQERNLVAIGITWILGMFFTVSTVVEVVRRIGV